MTAEELLMSGEVFNYSNVINIDGETRAINFPIGEEFFGVEGDKDVERKFFSAPKIVGDNVDLSKHNIYINYVLADKKGNPKSEDIEKYLCNDVVVDENRIKFSWKLSERVLKEDGYIAFSVMAKKSENGVLKTVWYTTPGIGSVNKTIREGSDLSQVYPDVLDNLINRILDLERILANGGGTGGSITVDDALSETSTNPVQNAVITKKIKDIYKNNENIFTKENNGTITWDGNAEGLYNVGNMYHVSDVVLTEEDCKNGLSFTVIEFGEEASYSYGGDEQLFDENGYGDLMGMIFVIPKDNYFDALNEVTYAKKGIYFLKGPDFTTTSLTVNGYTGFKKDVLKEEYIPNSIARKSELDKLSEEIVDLKESGIDAKSYYVTPQAFGAKGDGTTDDTTAFVNAINSLESGGTLFIPKGTYIINALNVANKSINIVGEDKYSTILKQKSGTGSYIVVLMLQGTNTENIKLCDFTIDGQNQKVFGMSIKYLNSVDISNCCVKNIGRNGYKSGNRMNLEAIRVTKVVRCTIDSCDFDTVERDAILGFPVTEMVVTRCKFYNIGRFAAANTQNDDTSLGYPLRSHFAENYAYNCGSGGFDAETYLYASQPHEARFINNTIVSCGSDDWGYNWAIAVGNNTKGVVSKNFISDFATNSSLTDTYCNAITVGRIGGNVVVSDNIVVNAKKRAIFLQTEQRDFSTSIVNNVVDGCNENGIFVSDTHSALISNNVIKNNKQNGVYMLRVNDATISGNNICNNSLEQANVYSGVMLEDVFDVGVMNNIISGTSHKYCINVDVDDTQNLKRLTIIGNHTKEKWTSFVEDVVYGEFKKGVFEITIDSSTPPETGTWNSGDKVYTTNVTEAQCAGWVHDGTKWCAIGIATL